MSRPIPGAQTFDAFASEEAYRCVNEHFVDRMFANLPPADRYQLLDIAAATGLMTQLAHSRAGATHVEIDSVLLDIDLPTLARTRDEHPRPAAKGYVGASADSLPFGEGFDLAILANSIHLLSAEGKVKSLAEAWRVLRPRGVLGINSAFYDGAYPRDSLPFYSRWMRRAVAKMSRSRPNRKKASQAQARQWLSAADYESLVTSVGFRVREVRERQVLLNAAALRAISNYKEFAMGALHATEEDSFEACKALESTVGHALCDVGLKSLPHNWLEIIAIKP